MAYRSRQSWFSRLMNSVVGVIIGLIISAGSLVCLVWNEGRAVHRARELAEGAEQVQTVPSTAIDAAKDGKLVHVQGATFCEGDLSDPEFGIQVHALHLTRLVEMYQWRETSKSKTRRRAGGSSETVREYHYDKTWSSSHIDSNRFHEANGHQNPAMPSLPSMHYQADDVTVGAFHLPAALVQRIEKSEPVAIDVNRVDARWRSQVRATSANMLLLPASGSPTESTESRIGDTRIQFQMTRPQDVSIIAMQQADKLEPYVTSQGGAGLYMLSLGSVAAQQMFDEAKAANVTLTWILRGVGSFAMFLGCALVLHPLSVVADVIPIAGTVVRAGTTLVAFLVAAIAALAAIATGWFVYRPWLAASIFLVAFALVILLVGRLRRHAVPPAVPLPPTGPSSPPPAPPVAPPPIPR